MESTSTTEIVSPTPSRCSTTPSSRSAGSWPGTRAAPAVATPATCGRGSPGAPRLASRSSVFAGPHRALRPVVDGGGTTPRLSHHRPTTVDGGRLLPLRRRRRLHRRLSGRARPSAEDRLRIDHPRARPHGAGRLPGQRCRRQPGRPRPRLPPRLARTPGLGGVLHQHRAPQDRAPTSNGEGRGQGGQGGRDPVAAPCRPSRRPGRRRAHRGSSSAFALRTTTRPHGATRIVRRVARKAGITKQISPHSLRARRRRSPS